MTLISHKKEFVFIHIYKTAGTAITDSLIKHSCLKDRLAYDFYITEKLANTVDRIFNTWDYGKKWLTGYHKHAKAFEIREYLGAERFDRYYKFAFVRNTWDWLASFYFYVKREQTHRDHQLANQLSFKEYLIYYLSSKPELQIDFITDSQGKVIVDEIYRFENLERDFPKLLDKLNIENKQAKTELEVMNKSTNRSRDYTVYYDEELISLVADYFKRDIEHFQFSFDYSLKS